MNIGYGALDSARALDSLRIDNNVPIVCVTFADVDPFDHYTGARIPWSSSILDLHEHGR